MKTTETPLFRVLLILGFGTMVAFLVSMTQWATHLTSPFSSSLIGLG